MPTTRRSTYVTDTSLVEAIRESLESPSGVLFPYRNIATGTTDTEGIRRVLIAYWAAVHDVFEEAWAKPATESRLMDGVGIRAMGRLMDRVMAHVQTTTPRPSRSREGDLADREALRLDGGVLGRTRPCVERPAEHPSAHQRALQLPGPHVPS